MSHRTAARIDAAREIVGGLPLPLAPANAAGAPLSRRAEHARMLAHAAVRRRRASGGDERDYWRACAPAAVARATRLREEASFARLP
jgi:hypothetical protein